jgi:3-methyl-2-oxobutanoate hydroxymethyltransferase
MRKTINDIRKLKEEGIRSTMLTAYDYTISSIIDGAGIDMILVGDSVGNVALGYEDTLPVTMDDMVHHCAAVSRGCKNALLVCDMPFMSYQASDYDAVINAGRLLKEGGANAVKIEGGVEFEDTIRAVTRSSVPVCAHIGLTPQSVNAFGGYKVQGRSLEAAKKLIEDAKAIRRAGAFAVVLECVPAKLAEYITKEVLPDVVTIGIGAGSGCDGQVLVYADMCGLNRGHKAKFVKEYAKLGDMLHGAVKDYISDVQTGAYPCADFEYGINDEIMEKIREED